MKRFIIFLITLYACSMASAAQEFVTADRWTTITICNPEGVDTYVKGYFCLGEWVEIDGIKYQTLLNESQNWGAIRYTDNYDKLYYRSETGEYLLCDFSAAVGDTLRLYANQDPRQVEEQHIEDLLGTITPAWIVREKEIVDHRVQMNIELITTLHSDTTFTHTQMIQGIGSQCVVFPNRQNYFESDATLPYTICAYAGETELYTFEPDILPIHPVIPDYLSTSMRWIVEIVPEEMEGYIDTLRVSADSIVEGLKYKVIRNQLLRQDGHKIYCHFPGDSEFPAQDCLIYDFAPQVGDSIVKRLPGAEGCYHWSIVSKIDSTTLLDGRTARRITYTDNRVCVEFIGDLGGGLLAPTSDGWVEYYNKATYDGDTLLFQNRRQDILDPQHQPESIPTKQIVNGQLIIEANGKTFDVLGRECK